MEIDMKKEIDVDDYIVLAKYDKIMETKEWISKIPEFQFPSEWKVKIIPPFNGAVVRFTVSVESAKVSVYLDCYDNLGIYGQPYWEIYPHEEDVFRCEMAETDALLVAISQSITKQLS